MILEETLIIWKMENESAIERTQEKKEDENMQKCKLNLNNEMKLEKKKWSGDKKQAERENW